MELSNKSYYILILLLCNAITVVGQQKVLIDANIPVQELVETHLSNGCLKISDASSSINGNADGFISFGTFRRGNSNFPLESGIVLSTGAVTSGGNTTNDSDLSEGTLNWGTDPDIETYLGLGNTVNATAIEFDFVAPTDNIQFNYVLASEEYFANFVCNASDGFVFLIKESSSTGAYQNIALTPNTGETVIVNNIHDSVITADGCMAANAQYFEGYAIGDTNYNGRTKVLTANTSLLPNVQYRVKLIIADQSNRGIDTSYDTAVFIETTSFLEVDLGSDIDTCSENITLNGAFPNPLATYAWYRDDILVPNETSATLNTTSSGVYRVEVSVNSCVIQDEITASISNELSANPIASYSVCNTSNTGQETFDLRTKEADVETAIADLPANYTINYYLSDNDARNNPSNYITTPISTGPRSIYVRVEDTSTGCLIFGRFELILNPSPSNTQPTPLEVCDNDGNPDSITQIFLNNKDNEITGATPDLSVSYHFTQQDANSGENPISSPYINTNPNETIFVRITDTLTGCHSTTTISINVINGNTQVNRDRQYIDNCDTDHDGFSTFDITQVLDDILNGSTGFLPPTYHTSFSDAETGNSPIPNPENYTNINPNEQTIYLRLEDSSTGCITIIAIEIHTNLLLTETNIPKPDLTFCDQDGDGLAEVDLLELEVRIINNLPNVTVNFYESEINRDTRISPIDKSIPYVFSAGSSTRLYITLESNSCLEVSEFSLLINPKPSFDPISPISYCDEDDNGNTQIDFYAIDPTVTEGDTGFQTSYYSSYQDAENGNSALPRFYNTASDTFYVRITQRNTGCFFINSFDVIVTPAPTINNPTDIIGCDNDQDSMTLVNLETKIPEITPNTQGLDITFYENFDAADTGTNPIPNTDITAYNTPSKTIFVRVEEAPQACYSIAFFNIIIVSKPTVSNISSYQICVDSGTTSADYNLQTKDSEILSGQTDCEVFYFQDPEMNNPIDKTNSYNSNGNETIYVRIQSLTQASCYSTTSFELTLGNNPSYNTSFTDFPTVCQMTAGSHTFDLETKREELSLGSSDVLDIKFYLTLNEANNNTDSFLPNQYTTPVLQDLFYVRIENTASSCYVIEEIRFVTFPTPLITSAVIAPVCDTDYDGRSTIDLTTTEVEIENVRFSTFTLSFYEDANTNTQIPDSQTSNYNVTNSETIYVKVETSSGCSHVIALDLLVNLPPSLLPINTVVECYKSTNTYDLNQSDPLIISNSDLNQVNISYHDSAYNAENNTGIYSNKIFHYTATGDNTIHIRVEDRLTGCLAFTSFILSINPNPVANSPQDLIACDDDFDNLFVFDLSQNDAIALGSLDPNNFSVYHYDSLTNAENDISPLNKQHQVFGSETIYVRVENNDTGCFSIVQYHTVINPLPTIPLDEVIALCINDLPLILDADTGNPNDTYLWSTGETTPRIELIDPSQIGDYWVAATTPHLNSDDCTFTKYFKVIESENAIINFTTSVDFADPNSITVDVSGIGDYVFILDDGIPQQSHVFENVTYGLHKIIIRDLNGCNDVTTEVIVIDIPKFFTPNNDTVFDKWHIVGVHEIPGTIVHVFNRYGKLLKTLTHTSAGWDGTFNGENMPSDDYWFIAKVLQNGEHFDVRGHFALKR